MYIEKIMVVVYTMNHLFFTAYDSKEVIMYSN